MSHFRAIAAIDGAGDAQLVELDDATHELVVLDHVHHEIHNGDMFTWDEVVTLGASGTQDYVITTPNTTKWCHFGYDIESTAGGCVVDMYEAGDRTPTTAQTMRNRDRNSGTAATTTLHKGYSAGTTDGTKIFTWSSGTGASAGRISGKAGESSERVLKQNTQYIFRVTSKAASNDVSVRFNWYEHTNY